MNVWNKRAKLSTAWRNAAEPMLPKGRKKQHVSKIQLVAIVPRANRGRKLFMLKLHPKKKHRIKTSGFEETQCIGNLE